MTVSTALDVQHEEGELIGLWSGILHCDWLTTPKVLVTPFTYIELHVKEFFFGGGHHPISSAPPPDAPKLGQSGLRPHELYPVTV